MNTLLVSPGWPLTYWSFEKVLKVMGKKSSVPPLGLITMASLLPPQWPVQLVDRAFQVITEDQWAWAEVVMVSGMIVQSADMHDVVREAKRRGKTVVVGGPHPTLEPGAFRELGVDYLYQGEAENGFADLIDALSNGSAGGVFKEKGKADLSNAPIPRLDLLETDAYLAMVVQTSRGCPFCCEFCDVAILNGKQLRHKDADQVMLEIEQIYSLGFRGWLLISDDNFIGSRKHARSICEKLTPWQESRGKPFELLTQVSVNLGQDKEMIDLMTEANFSSVFIGIETPNTEALEVSRKYQNIRSPLAESLHTIIENGLSMIGSFVIGFDGEKKGMDEAICSFVEEAGIPMVMLNMLTAVPGTDLWYRLKRENRLLDPENHQQSSAGGLNFVPLRSRAEIEQEFNNALDRLYDPSKLLERAYKYHLIMRPTRKALASKAGKKVEEKATVKRVRYRTPLQDFVGFMQMTWRWGIVRSCRLMFWKYTIGIWMKNPSRIWPFLTALSLAENLIDIRRRVRAGEVLFNFLTSNADQSGDQTNVGSRDVESV